MLKNSKVAFFSVIDIYHKTSIIKNVFLKLKINSCFCLKQANKCEISQIKVLAIPFAIPFLLRGFFPCFSQDEIEFQLKMCLCNSNSVLGEKNPMRSLLPANIKFITVIYLEVLAEFSLKSTRFAYLHRKLISGLTL